jgi:hypothetical protein
VEDDLDGLLDELLAAQTHPEPDLSVSSAPIYVTGADVTQVHAFTGVRAFTDDGDRIERVPSIPGDLPALRDLVRKTGAACSSSTTSPANRRVVRKTEVLI